jgi:hypothetical protein
LGWRLFDILASLSMLDTTVSYSGIVAFEDQSKAISGL